MTLRAVSASLLLLLFLVVFIVSIGASPIALAATLPTGDFVLNNVNIVDVEHRRILRPKQLHVRAGHITRVDDATSDADTASIPVVDGNGGYVTPGLIDMHVHLYDKAALTIALSHGVTHVRIMNGIPAHLVWREQLTNGEWVGSTATVSSPIISAYDMPLHRTVLTADEMKQAVREYHAQGYDLIKAYGNLSAEALAALVEEADKLGMPVAKHGPHAAGDLPVTALAGIKSFEHVEDIYQGPLEHQFAPERLPAIIAELKATGVPITPTLGIFYQLTRLSIDKQTYLDTLPEDYISPVIAREAKFNQVKRWLNASDDIATHNLRTLAFLKDITGKLHTAGIPLLVGSDAGVLLSPHGLATHAEMRMLEQAGLSPFEVIAAATINPAQALGLGDELGQIKAGYRADFIFTRANPIDALSELETPAAVAKQGRWYTHAALKAEREQAIAARSLWSEIKNLLQAL